MTVRATTKKALMLANKKNPFSIPSSLTQGLTIHIPTRSDDVPAFIQADADDHPIVQFVCELLEPWKGRRVRGPKSPR